MSTLEKKEQQIVELFSNCENRENVYDKIIELGQENKDASFPHINEEYLVPGCQSLLYLYSEVKEGKLYFKAHSDALISMGLAHLLVWYYSGETAESILKNPPDFLEKLSIPSSLTPSRVNGLYNIHLKMKQKALDAIVSQNL